MKYTVYYNELYFPFRKYLKIGTFDFSLIYVCIH